MEWLHACKAWMKGEGFATTHPDNVCNIISRYKTTKPGHVVKWESLFSNLIILFIYLSVQHFTWKDWKAKKREEKKTMAASVMGSLSLKPSAFRVEKSGGRVGGLPTLSRRTFRVEASGGKKIKTDKPYGIFLLFIIFVCFLS